MDRLLLAMHCFGSTSWRCYEERVLTRARPLVEVIGKVMESDGKRRLL